MSEPYWVALGAQAVDYEGDWAAGTQYAPGDVVLLNGVQYLAVNPSVGQTPPSFPIPTASVVPLVTALPASPFDGQEVVLVDSLSAPTYHQRLRYSAAAGKWAFVGGTQELAVVEAFANTAVTATSDAAAQAVLTAPSLAYDGRPIIVSFRFGSGLVNPGGSQAVINLYDGSTDTGRLAVIQGTGTVLPGSVVQKRLVPTAGPHTYSIRAWSAGGTQVTFYASAANAPGDYGPIQMRVERV